jgi:hypothetical protein
MDFITELPPLLQVFWFIAIPASIIFIIQTVMTFMGTDATDGLDADFNGDMHSDGPLQIFSLRNLINFLLGFSWAGIAFYRTIESQGLLITVALLVGLAFFFIFFFIIKQLQKLAEDNSFKIAETLNKTAEVYLTIPANKSGKGKVLISVGGSTHELDAMTEKEEIKSGNLVKILRVDSEILIVELV